MTARAIEAPAAEEQEGAGTGSLMIGLALVAVYLIWGSTYLAIRIAVRELPPYGTMGARFILAGGLLYGFLRLRGVPNPKRQEWMAGGIIGVLLLVFGMGSVGFAEQWVPSSMAALLISTTPLWAAVWGVLWGKVPGRIEVLGLLVGIVGVALLNTGGNMGPHLWAVGIVLLAAVIWAFASVWSPTLPMPTGMMSSAVEMLCGGAAQLIISGVRGERLHGALQLSPVLAFFYLVTFGSLVAFSAYVYLVATVRPALATSYAYVNPVVAVFLGVLLAGEHISGRGIVALCVIVAGVVLVVMGSQKDQPRGP